MIDSGMMKDYNEWFNREPIQMFQDKDSDTLIAKMLSYYRCNVVWWDWRWLMGNLV